MWHEVRWQRQKGWRMLEGCRLHCAQHGAGLARPSRQPIGRTILSLGNM